MLSIELGQDKEPKSCPCCGGLQIIVYGFVYQDGNAYAIYHATWSASHPEAGIDIAIDFDQWGESNSLENRYSVGLIASSTKTEYQFRFIDPEVSSWGESEQRGRMLRREEALSHPQKEEFFHVAEHLANDDPRVKNALEQMV
jgi:hypothetical protein